MIRTLPSAAVNLMQEEQEFARFRRALLRADQITVDDLFVSPNQQTVAAQYAAHAQPFVVMMLALLLEEHKEVMKLRARLKAMIAMRNPPSLQGFDATESKQPEEVNYQQETNRF